MLKDLTLNEDAGSDKSQWSASWAQLEKITEEYKKCIVLCANCHRIETKRMINE